MKRKNGQSRGYGKLIMKLESGRLSNYFFVLSKTLDTFATWLKKFLVYPLHLSVICYERALPTIKDSFSFFPAQAHFRATLTARFYSAKCMARLAILYSAYPDKFCSLAIPHLFQPITPSLNVNTIRRSGKYPRPLCDGEPLYSHAHTD